MLRNKGIIIRECCNIQNFLSKLRVRQSQKSCRGCERRKKREYGRMIISKFCIGHLDFIVSFVQSLFLPQILNSFRERTVCFYFCVFRA